MSSSEVVRDEKGRLIAGTPSLNPLGRPRRAVEESTLKVLGEVWNEDEIRKVAKVILNFAQSGHISAAITIFHYMAGKPQERVALTSGDVLPDLTDAQINALLHDTQRPALPDGESNGTNGSSEAGV